MQRSSIILAALAVACAPAWAQTYPAKPVRLVLPYPPGGGSDTIARPLAQRLTESLGQQVVVDNRGGGSGTIGMEHAAKAPADGHTMLINNISLAINVSLRPKLPYDTLRDLAPVTLLGRQPNVLVVHPSLPARSIRELLDLARAKPRQLNYGSGGVGTASHLATELLKLMTNVEMVHIPYKGLGPALTELVGGQLQLIISTQASALPHIKAGRILPLAVTTAKRSAIFPQVPTMDEAGVPGYEFSTWYGLLVPAGTPPSIIGKLNAEMTRILGSAAVKQQFGVQGLEPESSTPREFGRYLRAEAEKWGKVVKASGARAE